uniref:Putative ovule protein n=1 Tax=Solanum chacoense TaxID=4108 RepID=A0A0V0H760_SOLCH
MVEQVTTAFLKGWTEFLSIKRCRKSLILWRWNIFLEPVQIMLQCFLLVKTYRPDIRNLLERFLKFWTENPSFIEVVRQNWCSNGSQNLSWSLRPTSRM